MIYFDVTKSGAARHQSGLMRVNARLRDELGPAAAPVAWVGGKSGWVRSGDRAPPMPSGMRGLWMYWPLDGLLSMCAFWPS